jgi:hypothetical protein
LAVFLFDARDISARTQRAFGGSADLDVGGRSGPIAVSLAKNEEGKRRRRHPGLGRSVEAQRRNGQDRRRAEAGAMLWGSKKDHAARALQFPSAAAGVDPAPFSISLANRASAKRWAPCL